MSIASDPEIIYSDQLGTISRPFSPQLKAGPTGLRQNLREIYYATRALEVAYTVKGIDVSYWQQRIDWAVAQARISFAFIRAGRGDNYIDSQLEPNRIGCTDNAIPYGLYWYVKPAGSYAAHASLFSTVWKEAPGVIYPVMDIEESGGLTVSMMKAWVRSLLLEFENKTGVKPIIYTSAGFWNACVGTTTWASLYRLWVANWTSAPNPTLPVSLTDWLFWQYTSKGDGAYYGAQSTYIDENWYNGTWTQFQQEFMVEEPVPTPSPAPETTFKMRVKATSTPYVNVRSGPSTNYADVGNLYPGTEFEVADIGGGNAWAQIKTGEFAGKWVCIQLNQERYCEKAPE